MKFNPRPFHRVLSLVLVLPLLATALSGMTYRLGRAWFGMSRETGDICMSIHTGEWLGAEASVWYVVVLGTGLAFLILSGARMLGSKAGGLHRWHRWLGLLLLVPLLASAVTGVAFKAGHEWFDLSKGVGDVLMTIHEGAWLGKAYKPFYILFIGAGLLIMACTGVKMSRLFK